MRGAGWDFKAGFGGDLTGKVTLEQRLEGGGASRRDIPGKEFPESGSSQCKDPAVGR